MQPLVFLLFAAVINAGVCFEPTCDHGWRYKLGNCYSFEAEAITWKKAVVECQNKTAILAEASSESVSNHLMDLARSNSHTCVWLGGCDLIAEGVWEWASSRTAFNFTNWASGEPNNKNNGIEDCLCMSPEHELKWNNANCNYHCSYICAKPAKTCTDFPCP
ncbi:hypothetical protein BsWGS_11921 [Bradybaena similaris]